MKFAKKKTTCLILVASVRRAVVDDHLVDLAELAKVLWFLEHVRIRQPGRQPHHEHQVPLDHPHVGQVLAVLADLLLLGLVLLPLLCLDPGQLLGGQGLEVGGVFAVGRPAGGAQARTLRADLVPAETADLEGREGVVRANSKCD